MVNFFVAFESRDRDLSKKNKVKKSIGAQFITVNHMKTRCPRTPEAASPSSDGLFDFGLIFWKGLGVYFQMLLKNWPIELEQKKFHGKRAKVTFSDKNRICY